MQQLCPARAQADEKAKKTVEALAPPKKEVAGRSFVALVLPVRPKLHAIHRL